MNTGESPEPGRPTGRGMIALVLALLTASVGTCAALAYFASSDPGFAVEPDYYAKSVDWDRRSAQQLASDALDWTTSLETQPRPGGQVRVEVTFRDAQAAPVEGARVHLEAFANARAARVQELDLVEEGGRYVGTLQLTTPGLWELRFRATRGADVHVHTVRRELRSAP